MAVDDKVKKYISEYRSKGHTDAAIRGALIKSGISAGVINKYLGKEASKVPFYKEPWFLIVSAAIVVTFLILVALLFFGEPVEQEEGCVTDLDCPYGYSCVEGDCVLDEDNVFDIQCGDGICDVGEEFCLEDCGCVSDSDCENGECIGGSCFAISVEDECESDEECDEGYYCVEGDCEEVAVEDILCEYVLMYVDDEYNNFTLENIGETSVTINYTGELTTFLINESEDFNGLMVKLYETYLSDGAAAIGFGDECDEDWGGVVPEGEECELDSDCDVGDCVDNECVEILELVEGDCDLVRLTDNEIYDYSPDVDADNLVWGQGGENINLLPNSNIFVYNYLSQSSVQLTNEGTSSMALVDGDYVVWVEYPNLVDTAIYLYEISSGDTIQLSDVAGLFAIGEDYVTWFVTVEVDGEYVQKLYLYNIISGVTEELLEVEMDDLVLNLDIEGDYIVWSQEGDLRWDVFLYEINSGDLLDLGVAEWQGLHPFVEDEFVYYVGYNDGVLYSYDIASGVTEEVFTKEDYIASWKYNFLVDGDYLIYSLDEDLYVKNLVNENEFKITDDGITKFMASFDDGIFSGYYDDGNDYEIFYVDVLTCDMDCVNDEDCGEGEICIDGDCFVEEEIDCVDDEDCVDGICIDGDCVECAEDNDCAEGEICDNNVCVEEPVYVECFEDNDCAEGFTCIDHECVEEELSPLSGARCGDGYDNDGDGLIDMLDEGCESSEDDDERNECGDGYDNDNDGRSDQGDGGCLNVADDDESDDVGGFKQFFANLFGSKEVETEPIRGLPA